jgi:hypothetical protein
MRGVSWLRGSRSASGVVGIDVAPCWRSARLITGVEGTPWTLPITFMTFLMKKKLFISTALQYKMIDSG